MDPRTINEIVARVADAPRVLLLLDFDGTLAPFVSRPEDARLSEPARDALMRISPHSHTAVGIVSARALEDLIARVGLTGLIYAGNHGLDIKGPGLRHIVSPPPLEPVLAAVRESLAICEGAWIEDKTMTATVHFRGAQPRERAELERIIRWIVDASPSHRWQNAAEALEIVPRVDWNKGAAARWIRSSIGWNDALTLYAGDDFSDESAFEALSEGVTIKIGDGPTKARYQADQPDELWCMLRDMAVALESSHSR